MDGELLAAPPPDEFRCSYIVPLGDYICISAPGDLEKEAQDGLRQIDE